MQACSLACCARLYHASLSYTSLIAQLVPDSLSYAHGINKTIGSQTKILNPSVTHG